MTLSLIVAMDECDGIGKGNSLPWRLPNDLKYFQEKTEHKKVVMGRKTYQSLPKLLKNREHYVLSRGEFATKPGVVFHVKDMNEVLQWKNDIEETFIIGGSNIYEQFLPHVDRIYLTRIHDIFEVDATFPKINLDEWEEVSQTPGVTDKDNKYEHTFYVYHRKA